MSPVPAFLPAQRSARAHLQSIVIIAVPVALSQLAQMAMGVTDTIMLGNINESSLAAGGLGAQIFFSCLFCLQGALSGVGVLIAQALGAGERNRVGAIYSSGIVLALLLGVPIFALAAAPQALLHLAGEPQALCDGVATYLGVMKYGVPGAMLGLGLFKLVAPAIGQARLLMWISPAAIVLNAGLNLWFIHGGWFLPAYGLRGSAAATACTTTTMAVVMAVLLHSHHHSRNLLRLRPILFGVIKRLLKIGLPVTITVTAEVSLFLVTGLKAGQLGETSLAAHTIAINVASISFMVPLAISQATNVVVASTTGARLHRDARRAGLTGIGLGLTVMGCASLVIATNARHIALLYLGATAAASTVELAVSLLTIAAVFQLVDGLQVVSSGALRGLADTRVPMMIALFGYWGIGLMSGQYLAFERGLGVRGLWWGLFAGLGSTGLCLVSRFLWRTRAHAGVKLRAT